jgi:hypothetical protein
MAILHIERSGLASARSRWTLAGVGIVLATAGLAIASWWDAGSVKPLASQRQVTAAMQGPGLASALPIGARAAPPPGQVPLLTPVPAPGFMQTQAIALAEVLKRGRFDIAAQYIELTDYCREAQVSLPAALLATEGCVEGSLAAIDQEFERLLTMGANQQNPEAEVALAKGWMARANRALGEIEPASPAAFDEAASTARRSPGAVAYVGYIESALAVLRNAAPHNPDAAELLRSVEESGVARLAEPVLR